MKKISTSLAMIFTLMSLSTMAQGLGGTESVEMDQISIDGQYQSYASSPRRESASDRMKNYRQKLERKNEVMMRKKIEQIRYKNEIRLMKKMQKAMGQTLNAIDNIDTN